MKDTRKKRNFKKTIYNTVKRLSCNFLRKSEVVKRINFTKKFFKPKEWASREGWEVQDEKKIVFYGKRFDDSLMSINGELYNTKKKIGEADALYRYWVESIGYNGILFYIYKKDNDK